MILEQKKTILIAGGTGFIGKKLIQKLEKSYEIKILTRNKAKCGNNFYYWNPEKAEIDLQALENVNYIINLCGAGIADKRWTKARKQELFDSRIIPANFLFSLKEHFTNLESYISASGINCYDLNSSKKHIEEDAFGTDFVSNLVKEWEQGAEQFEAICKVCKLRIGFVISKDGGGFSKLSKAIKLGFGSPLGTGNQLITWIHIDDLCTVFEHAIKNQLQGNYNTFCAEISNKEITKIIAKVYKKPLFLTNVPSFLLKIILGEMSVLVLKGISASNQKLLDSGFTFSKNNLELAIS